MGEMFIGPNLVTVDDVLCRIAEEFGLIAKLLDRQNTRCARTKLF